MQLTEQEKINLRINVAKDIIESLDQNKIKKLHRGSYLKGYNTFSINLDDELQDHVEEIYSDCRVCALGACFVTLVKLTDDLKVGQVFSSFGSKDGDTIANIVRERLLKVFEPDQLILIEAAFEQRSSYEIAYLIDGCCNDTDRQNAIDWGKRYVGVHNVLRAICENIIANNGTFIPD